MELNNISFLSNNATNCITKIPQDIKLTLESGVLTLKAGSKVYVPNGTNTFDAININENITLSISSTGTFFIFLYTENNNLRIFGASQCFSGTAAPTGQTYMMWYDTTNNVIKVTENSGSTWTPGYSFPLAIVIDNTRIDTIFNGVGYIGSHAFILPGVRGLCPDGFDEGGVAKNAEIKINQVSLSYLDPAWGINYNDQKFYVELFDLGGTVQQPDSRWAYGPPTTNFTGNYFSPTENKWFWYVNGVRQNQSKFIVVADFWATITATSSSIKTFVPRKVFGTSYLDENYFHLVLPIEVSAVSGSIEFFIKSGWCFFRLYGLVSSSVGSWAITTRAPKNLGHCHINFPYGNAYINQNSNDYGTITYSQTTANAINYGYLAYPIMNNMFMP